MGEGYILLSMHPCISLGTILLYCVCYGGILYAHGPPPPLPNHACAVKIEEKVYEHMQPSMTPAAWPEYLAFSSVHSWGHAASCTAFWQHMLILTFPDPAQLISSALQAAKSSLQSHQKVLFTLPMECMCTGRVGGQ